MSRNSSKKKNSTSKYREFKISPLIPVVAIIEVVILVVISSYAWYAYTANKTLDTGTISVDADSGLDIDFQYSNVDDYINIWNYIDTDFEFEPATSLDGRNIYFPTSNTFGNTDTGEMVFRDGTINDINSKYLNIDFELTNTSDYDMDVYLNNSSYFRVRDDADNLEESRALRLAFYTNDGNSGNVGSSLLSTTSNQSSDGSSDTGVDANDYYTFYFDTVANTRWTRVYAYFYDSDYNSTSDSWTEYHTAWPGVEMSYFNGKVYSLSLPQSELEHYDKVIFTNGYSGTDNQTSSRNVSDAQGKKAKMYSDSYETITTKTVYFVKPYSWSTVRCKTYTSTTSLDSYSDDEMTYVGSGIYAYTFYYQYNDGSNHTNIQRLHFYNGSWQGTNQTEMVSSSFTDGAIYYASSTNSSGNYTLYNYSSSGGQYYSNLQYNTIYFFNTYSWEKPYATVTIGSGTQTNTYNIPMVSLSGNVYYCTVPAFYTYVYFRDKNQSGNDTASLRSSQVSITGGTVYRPIDTVDTSGYHELSRFEYDAFTQSSGYPVISPGVSVGFQRPYSPVVTIDTATGLATEVVPAFSNSIDTYILGSGNPIFTLESGHMVSLSMVVWLEGTDEATYGDTYPGNNIELRLEFSTMFIDSESSEHIVNPGKDPGTYTYNFYDKTREVWTADRQSTESGVTVAPVMQLYDNTTKRGYLMSPSAYTTYDGSSKVSCWSVTAPQSIAVLGHDIIFRRVNPYDEDEVWNYWHAGRVAGGSSDPVYDDYEKAGTTRYTPYDIAFSGGNTISFTAFADGSPTEDNLTAALKKTNPSITAADIAAALTSADVPAVSCGGLWGNHSVRTVTMYDGLSGQPLKDNNGIITVNYSYNYTVNGSTARTAKIEYKASGPNYNSIYYIIMPNSAYTNGVSCTFKNYTGFDSTYAINSDLNDEITYHAKYGENSVPRGDYFELCRATDDSDFSYWGSDILYIQTSYYTKDDFITSSSKNKLLQVHFYAGSSTDNSNDFYSYLYYNAQFNVNGASDASGGTGFAAVIPNDKAYVNYRVESCSYNGASKYNITPKQSIASASTSVVDPVTTDSIGNYSMTINHVNEKNICKLDNIYVWMYVQMSTNYCGYNWNPDVYTFYGNAIKNSTFPGDEMTYVEDVSGTLKKYKFYVDLSRYGNVIISNQHNNTYWQTDTLGLRGASTTKNGMIIEITSASSNTHFNHSILNVTQSGETTNETIQADTYACLTWPHYLTGSSS